MRCSFLPMKRMAYRSKDLMKFLKKQKNEVEMLNNKPECLLFYGVIPKPPVAAPEGMNI